LDLAGPAFLGNRTLGEDQDHHDDEDFADAAAWVVYIVHAGECFSR
jgi:hypothetical protein